METNGVVLRESTWQRRTLILWLKKDGECVKASGTAAAAEAREVPWAPEAPEVYRALREGQGREVPEGFRGPWVCRGRLEPWARWVPQVPRARQVQPEQKAPQARKDQQEPRLLIFIQNNYRPISRPKEQIGRLISMPSFKDNIKILVFVGDPSIIPLCHSHHSHNKQLPALFTHTFYVKYFTPKEPALQHALRLTPVVL